MVLFFSILVAWFLLSIPFGIAIGTIIRRCDEIDFEIRTQSRRAPVAALIPV